MIPWLAAADPARLHHEGRLARDAVEQARGQLAALVGVRPRQVVFTASGTEAVNTAVRGAISLGRTQILAAGVEHSAVTSAAVAGDVLSIPVDGCGRIDPGAIGEAIADGTTTLVNCQWANHEVGTIQPVAEVAEAAHREGAWLHVDACAAVGHVPTDFDASGADLLSLSGHKFGGPHGIGALVLGKGIRIPALLTGGAQERGRRAGMENVAAIVGLGAAAELLTAGCIASETARAWKQACRLTDSAKSVGGITVYGPDSDSSATGPPTDRVPHILCLGVDGIEAEAIVIGLDQSGVAVHSGSACSAEELEPSPVLAAMGVDADHSLRFSVGRSTTDEDIAAASAALKTTVDRLRALGRPA